MMFLSEDPGEHCCPRMSCGELVLLGFLIVVGLVVMGFVVWIVGGW
jgi:hypothetical protein